jgi:hypothetical protein
MVRATSVEQGGADALPQCLTCSAERSLCFHRPLAAHQVRETNIRARAAPLLGRDTRERTQASSRALRSIARVRSVKVAVRCQGSAQCSTRFDAIDNRSSKLDCRQCLLDRGLLRLARSCGKPPNPGSPRRRRAAAGLRARSAHPGCATASTAVSSVRPPPPSVHRVRRWRPQYGRGSCHEDCRKFEYSECGLRCQLFGRSRREKQDAFLHQHRARGCGGRRNRYRYRAPALLPIGLGACRTGPGVEAPRRRTESGGRHGVEVLK